MNIIDMKDVREIALLRSALIAAREKLIIYRKLHPKYVDGPEYSILMRSIDYALDLGGDR